MISSEQQYFVTIAIRAALLNGPTEASLQTNTALESLAHITHATNLALEYKIHTTDSFALWLKRAHISELWGDYNGMKQYLDNAHETANQLDSITPRQSAAMAKLFGDFYRENGRLAEAERSYIAAINEAENHAPSSLMAVKYGLGIIYLYRGELAKAEKITIEALEHSGSIHWTNSLIVLRSYSILISVTTKKCEFHKAWRLAVQLHNAVAELAGDSSLFYAESLRHLAEISIQLGEYDGIEQLLHESATIYRRYLGDNSRRLGEILQLLGHLYQITGQYVAAESASREAMEIIRNVLGDRHWLYGRILCQLSGLHGHLGNLEVALDLATSSVQVLRLTPNLKDDLGLAVLKMAWINAGLGRADEADRHYVEAFDLLDSSLGPHHVNSCKARIGFGEFCLATGRIKEGISALNHVLNSHCFDDKCFDKHMTVFFLGLGHKLEGNANIAITQCRDSLDSLLRLLGENHMVCQRLTAIFQKEFGSP